MTYHDDGTQEVEADVRDCSKIGVSGPTRRAEFRRDGHGE